MSDKPVFPIKVFFKEDGDEWILDNEDEIASSLEWFNSEDPEENTIVTDKNGNPVKLVIEKLEIKQLELKE